MSRPLQKIIPLEVVETPEVNPIPRRQCAVTGEERDMPWDKNEDFISWGVLDNGDYPRELFLILNYRE